MPSALYPDRHRSKLKLLSTNFQPLRNDPKLNASTDLPDSICGVFNQELHHSFPYPRIANARVTSCPVQISKLKHSVYCSKTCQMCINADQFERRQNPNSSSLPSPTPDQDDLVVNLGRRAPAPTGPGTRVRLPAVPSGITPFPSP